MYKKIMLTVDGSALAEQALPHAIDLANRFDAELVITRVILPITLLTPTPMDYDLAANYRMNALNEASEYLTLLEARIKPEVHRKIHVKVLEGVIVDSLLDFAELQHIDLIVMATHGRSGLGRWVFGSVADRILRSAKVPVFLVRAQAQPVKNKKAEDRAAV